MSLPPVTFLNALEFLIVYPHYPVDEHYSENDTFKNISLEDMEAKLFPLSLDAKKRPRVSLAMSKFRKIKGVNKESQGD